jgi:hypothetical protein
MVKTLVLTGGLRANAVKAPANSGVNFRAILKTLKPLRGEPFDKLQRALSNHTYVNKISHSKSYPSSSSQGDGGFLEVPLRALAVVESCL